MKKNPESEKIWISPYCIHSTLFLFWRDRLILMKDFIFCNIFNYIHVYCMNFPPYYFFNHHFLTIQFELSFLACGSASIWVIMHCVTYYKRVNCYAYLHLYSLSPWNYKKNFYGRIELHSKSTHRVHHGWSQNFLLFFTDRLHFDSRVTGFKWKWNLTGKKRHWVERNFRWEGANNNGCTWFWRIAWNWTECGECRTDADHRRISSGCDEVWPVIDSRVARNVEFSAASRKITENTWKFVINIQEFKIKILQIKINKKKFKNSIKSQKSLFKIVSRKSSIVSNA